MIKKIALYLFFLLWGVVGMILAGALLRVGWHLAETHILA